jgi:hypothetical protein
MLAPITSVIDANSPYSPDGTPWWHLKIAPGKWSKFGGGRWLAAYLWFKLRIGDTMRDLR